RAKPTGSLSGLSACRSRRHGTAPSRRGERRPLNLYAESSAVLAWLLGETRAEEARSALAGADLVLTSDLALIECERALIRAVRGKSLTDSKASRLRTQLRLASTSWTLVPL